jgi:hypothetical protein
VNVVNDAAEPIALYRIGIERQYNQRQFVVVRKQLAADNLARADPADELLISGAAREIVGNQRRRELPVLRRLACREHRNDTPCPIDQLQVSNEIANLLD